MGVVLQKAWKVKLAGVFLCRHSLLSQVSSRESSSTDMEVDMELPIWPLPALIFVLCSHAILQMKIEAVKRAINVWGFLFSTLTKIFSARAQMGLQQSPNSALQTALPWAKQCCLKSPLSKGSTGIRLQQLSGVPIPVLDAS